MTKCRLYECQEEVKGNYPFCSGTHWKWFQDRKDEMDTWFSANLEIKQSAWYKETKLEGNKPYRANYNIKEIELLNQF